MKHYKTLKALVAVMALALICSAFSSVKVSAKSSAPAGEEYNGNYSAIKVKYDANLDAIVVEKKSTDVPTKIGTGDDEKDNKVYLFYNVKEDTNWKNSKALDIEDINDTKAGDEENPDTTEGQVIALTADPLKIKTSADAYFIVVASSGSISGISGEHTLEVKKSEWKKPTVTIDYNAAYEGNEACALGSVIYKAAAGKTSYTEVAGQLTDLLEGDGNKNSVAFGSLEWSEDGGKTWYRVLDSDHGFTGDKLAKLIASVSKTNKVNIYFRQGGVSSNQTEGAYRPSDMAKVSIKEAAKAPSVKLDVKKVASIAIKQKFDYQVLVTEITPEPTEAPDPTGTPEPASPDAIGINFEFVVPNRDADPAPASGGAASPAAVVTPTPEPDKWITILPYNKGGDAGSPYMVTTDFKAVKITKTSGEEVTKYYTNDESAKKNLPVAKLLTYTGVIWSGTDTKDCRFNQKIDYITLAADERYTVWVRKSATSSKPATKYSSITFDGEAAEPAVELNQSTGTYISFLTATGVMYQYAVVPEAELKKDDPSKCNIDWSTLSWKTLNSGTQIKAGVKIFSYKLASNSAKSTLSGTVAAVGDYVLVRVAGDKIKNVIPSAYSIYKITANTAKTLITAVPVSFTPAERTLAAVVMSGSTEVATGDAINYTADFGGTNTYSLKFKTMVGATGTDVTSSKMKEVVYECKKAGATTTDIAVDKTGKVTATKNGTYTIKATYNGLSVTLTIVVTNVDPEVKIDIAVTGSGINVATTAAVEYTFQKESNGIKLQPKLFIKGTDKTSSAKELAFTYTVKKAGAASTDITVNAADGVLTIKDDAEGEYTIEVKAAWKDGDNTLNASATLTLTVEAGAV